MWGSTVDAVTYPMVADRGRQIPDYSAQPTLVAIKGVELQPGASTELTDQHLDLTAVRWTLYIKLGSLTESGVTLTDKSIVRVLGADYQVMGVPGGWVDGSPLDHIVAYLEAWQP